MKFEIRPYGAANTMPMMERPIAQVRPEEHDVVASMCYDGGRVVHTVLYRIEDLRLGGDGIVRVASVYGIGH